MRRLAFAHLLRTEFAGYDAALFRRDFLAGVTVAAVALPLALAFGVVSGASAAAGLVTAILAGTVIGGLSGAPYQVSGPTGAMSAVLIALAGRYGLPGVWVAGVMAGVILLVIGLLRLGRFITFIPAPVVTGFTSGVALIIAIGQVDNLLGVPTPRAESAAIKLIGYFKGGYLPDAHALALGVVVIALMLAWPKAWNARFPASLLGIILATGVAGIAGWTVPIIGAIPRTLLLDQRLTLGAVPWADLPKFVAPALTISALGAVESLLCGAVASNMTGIRLHANQELVAQGAGNIVIPFFGGVPATAAIARTSVGIKSGGRTRMVSIVHALALLASMFALAPAMSRVPLAALAAVLVVTAWRMNEWDAIRYIFGRRFKTAMLTYGITLLATITLDLTQAILIGACLSAAVFLNQIARLDVDVKAVEPAKLRPLGIVLRRNPAGIRVVYLTGPLFFAATDRFSEAVAHLEGIHTLILSVRGVPQIDTSGLQALLAVVERLHATGGTLMLAGVQPDVHRMLDRGGVITAIGADNLFWGADEAIVAADARRGAAAEAPTASRAEPTGRVPPSPYHRPPPPR